MIINELSELEDLVTALRVLVDSNIEISVDIDNIVLVHGNKIDFGNTKCDFRVILKSDEIENLFANAERIKVTK